MPGGRAKLEGKQFSPRPATGRERAKARGVKLGRKVEAHPAQAARGDPATQYQGGASAGDCQIYNVYHSTISRLKA
jgi:hypothetical protein